jgi:hypothetical protein
MQIAQSMIITEAEVIGRFPPYQYSIFESGKAINLINI